MPRSLVSLVIVLSVALTAGCDSDSDDHASGDDSHVETVGEEACEHMVDGPSVTVTADADATGTPPDATTPHTRIDVELVEVDGGFGGVVTFASSEAAEWSFFLDADVPFAVSTAAGDAVDIEHSDPVDACDEVVIVHSADLAIGAHHLTFGPVAEATIVGLVFEEAGDHDH